MKNFIPKIVKKKPPRALTEAFAEIRRGRVEGGFRNEELIVRDLDAAPAPDEEVPPWFGGIDRATEEQDRYEATDFFVTLLLEPDPDGHRLTEIRVPVNAKSSEWMAKKLADSHHNRARERHPKVPILGFVVDPQITRRERRAAFFRAFAENGVLRRWLAAKGYAFAEKHESRANAAARTAAKLRRIQARDAKATRQRLVAARQRHLSAQQRLVASQQNLVERRIDGARRGLNAVIAQGLATNRRSLRRQIVGICRSAMDTTPNLKIREAVALGVHALRGDPAIRGAVQSLGERLGSSIHEARLAVRQVDSRSTAAEAEKAIGVIFRLAFESFRAGDPRLGTNRIKNRFVNAGKEAFLVWHRRAARAFDSREAAPESPGPIVDARVSQPAA